MAELLSDDYIDQLVCANILTDDESVFVAEIRRSRAIARHLVELIRIVDHRTGVSQRRTKEHTDRLEALIEGVNYPEAQPWQRRPTRGKNLKAMP